MLREQLLQQKLRKSESLTQKDIYLDFMQYAREVSDQMDIYLYMEENGIGLDQAKYWIARMEIMRKQCQLRQLVKLANELRNRQDIQQPFQISNYRRDLAKHFKNVFNMQFRGKRRAADFNKVVEDMQPERRKIGNIQVYVDQDCRHNYELEDFAQYIMTKMPDYCQIERQDYKRRQNRKPPSFIAKRQLQLMNLAQQVLSKAGRKSLQERKSIDPTRLSNKVNMRDSNKIEVDAFNTPKTSIGNTTINTSQMRRKRKKDSSRDSIQILKQDIQFTSPKFAENQKKPHQRQEPIERCRAAKASYDDFMSFSFGKSKQSQEQEKRRRASQQKQLMTKDNAFLFHSFSKDPRQSDKQNINNFIKKEDFELELIIKQIQRQNYQKMDSKTFSSQIDTNQENQYFSKILFESSNKKQRRPFQILLEVEGKLFNPRTMKLQQLIDFDEQNENRNPESVNFCGNQNFFSAEKHRSSNGQYHSENKRHLSNISEESSCFFSHSKNKITRSK